MGPRASGRCLCGAITFTVTGPIRDVTNCHCHRCRRWTGHHMAASDAAVADLAIADADQLLTWFFPVPDAGYGFCARCGSSLFWQSTETPERMSICAGVLEAPTGLTTVGAWWVSEAGDYHERPGVREWATEP